MSLRHTQRLQYHLQLNKPQEKPAASVAILGSTPFSPNGKGLLFRA
jgi:hypothetical protein